jgi:hypothetical protein
VLTEAVQQSWLRSQRGVTFFLATAAVYPGVTCAPIKVKVPQLDEDHAAAAAASASSGSSSSKGSSSAAAGGGGPSSWHQLWGAGAYQDVLPNAAAGSFLLGETLRGCFTHPCVQR